MELSKSRPTEEPEHSRGRAGKFMNGSGYGVLGDILLGVDVKVELPAQPAPAKP